MRILIAPDKFKGTLSAKEAAFAIERGAHRAADEAGVSVTTVLCPVADGGEGTLDALAPTLGGERRTVRVHGPLTGMWVEAPVLFFQDGKGLAAFVESARAVSMSLVSKDKRDPERTVTRGVGEMIRAAVDFGAGRVLIAVGGSSTVDGGAGAAAALGVRFVGRDGREIEPRGGTLNEIRRIEGAPAKLGIDIVALHDVTNPLLGANGAARVYGPQKGASPEQVERLEAGMENLVRACRESGVACDPCWPGAGSAGGLGFGLATFLGAELVPGAPFILDLLKFDERIARADLVITGEGRLDSQTASGKAAAEVARRAAAAGRPCYAVVGSTEGTAAEARSALAAAGVDYAGVASAAEAAGSAEKAMSRAGEWLEEAASRAMREYLSSSSRAS